jgi:hypothetical protein
MTKQEAMELIAQKTKQMQDLLDEAQTIADEHEVEFRFSLEATGRWIPRGEVLAGTYHAKGTSVDYEEIYNEETKEWSEEKVPNKKGYFYWANSSLNC